MTTLSPRAPKLGLSDLDAFERQLGRRIPSDYRQLLLRWNGGRPDRTDFTHEWLDGRRRLAGVREFIGVYEGDYSLGWWLEMSRGRIPKDLFPIADDEGGNLILIGAEGPREGKIFFWHHELEASDGEPAHEDNVFFVADSLDEFLSTLEAAQPQTP